MSDFVALHISVDALHERVVTPVHGDGVAGLGRCGGAGIAGARLDLNLTLVGERFRARAAAGTHQAESTDAQGDWTNP